MKMFDVYNQYPLEPVKGTGAYVYDAEGNTYLDFYGGHAVISVGHSHPHYVQRVTEQLKNLGFYSNAVVNGLQKKLADLLEEVSGVQDYELFLCNSGAEANENALKLASFKNGKTKILALKNGFHGRTSAAVRVTDNEKIQAPINQKFEVEYFDINDSISLQNALQKGDVCAVVLESIQGIGGCFSCSVEFLKDVSKACKINDAILIMDEVQCGYGRSGDFFAFQDAGIEPDVITTAKGMGNGFPIAGVLINSKVFESKKGMLGTTFGGNHLACAAGIAVLEIIRDEDLVNKTRDLGNYFKKKLSQSLPEEVEVLGRGLMIGLKFGYPSAEIRKELLFNEHIFSGSSGNPNIMRILPPLNISKSQIDEFIKKLVLVYNSKKPK